MMNDTQIHDIANEADLLERLEVRIGWLANYTIDFAGADQPTIDRKPKARLALMNPAGEVSKFLWHAVMNTDVQDHYSGTDVLPIGDQSTIADTGTLTGLLAYVVDVKAQIIWAP